MAKRFYILPLCDPPREAWIALLQEDNGPGGWENLSVEGEVYDTRDEAIVAITDTRYPIAFDTLSEEKQ